MSDESRVGFGAWLAPVGAPGSTGQVDVPAAWGQGRATFGGLLVAGLIRAMRASVDGDRPLRSLTVNFAGPVSPGSASLVAAPLRAGRAVATVEAKARQDGEVRVAATGAFGAALPSRLRIESVVSPEMAAPEGCVELPYLEGVTPAFTRYFEYRIARGGLPFSGAEGRELGGYVRFRSDRGPADAEAIAALVDAWPPVVLPRLEQPAPASSVTWMLDFADASPDGDLGDWWRYHAHAEAAGDGYVHSRAALWSPSDRLVALSTQAIAVFDGTA